MVGSAADRSAAAVGYVMTEPQKQGLIMKYEYMLHTWGGFYNEEHQRIHKHNEGYHFFDTEEAREGYLEQLKKIEKELNTRHLAHTKDEGYHLRDGEVIAHRVCEYQGKRYHTTREFPPGYPYESAVYFMRWKWYPGFNDYPLGEDFDYDKNKVEVIQEWVSGSFKSSDDNY